MTGSSNGCIAALIAKHELLPARDGEIRYVAEQGLEMGQPGRVYVRVTGMPGRTVAYTSAATPSRCCAANCCCPPDGHRRDPARRR